MNIEWRFRGHETNHTYSIANTILSGDVWAGASRFFDGVDDKIEISNFIDPNATAMSVLMWVYPTAWQGSSNMTAIQQLNGTGTGRTWLMVDNASGSDKRLNSAIGQGSNLQGSTNIFSRLDEWIHFAVTSSGGGAGTTTTLYLDGVQESQITDANPDASDGDHRIAQHKGPSTALEEWKGNLAYLSVYNRELSISEIKELMHRPTAIVNGLQAFLPIWGSDSPEIDLSGNGNTGTVTEATESALGPPVFLHAPGAKRYWQGIRMLAVSWQSLLKGVFNSRSNAWCGRCLSYHSV